ncbi:hypothetical protein KYK29_03185 [Shinella daejeonensis]|nr:hypothetical protein [Shinella daejeonensis]
MQTRKPPIAATKDTGKLRLRTLSDLDGRSTAYKIAAGLRDDMIADAGGVDALSAVKVKLVESVATMTAVIEHYHSLILSGDTTVPLGELATLTNTRNRTAQLVGLGKASKTLDLDDYVSQTYGAKQ